MKFHLKILRKFKSDIRYTIDKLFREKQYQKLYKNKKNKINKKKTKL